MKVAVTSRGNDPHSLIDPRFGRCAWFAVYDTESQALDFVENTARNAASGAGPAAVSVIAEQGVSTIIAGEFGPKIRQMLTELGIHMVSVKEEKTIAQVVADLH